ncbi:tyrosine-type recombinase/integrase [Streptomyces sp. NPDC057686]|uniref:tyrosine-type recombinase/integrase n=1 Tax=Streptomyces sp. NPDC057686 TaxID=3346212 RepID=UPI0036C33225
MTAAPSAALTREVRCESEPKQHRHRVPQVAGSAVPVLTAPHWFAGDTERSAPLDGSILADALRTHCRSRRRAARGPAGFETMGPRRQRIRLHDARHGCATLLFAAGVPPRVVMEILGHSQIAVTMNIYTHVTDGSRREAMGHMDRLLRRRRPAE